MFTGIITDIGRVVAAEERGDLRLRIACGYDMESVDLGASIACSGVCLTVVDKGEDWFAVDVSRETRRRSASGPLGRGRAAQPRALAPPRRRAWRPYRHRPCRRRRRGGLGGAERRFRARRHRRARSARPLHCREGLDRHRRRIADRQRGRRTPASESTSSRTQRRRRRSAILRPGVRVNIEIDILARYIGRMLELRR